MRSERLLSRSYDASDRAKGRSSAGRGLVSLVGFVGRGRPRVPEALGFDSVLPKEVVEGGPTHIDLPRRPGDVAGVAGERLHEEPALRLVAGCLERTGTLLLRLGQLEIFRSQVGIPSQDHPTLHPVLELAHVSRPGMGLDGAQRRLRESANAAFVV